MDDFRSGIKTLIEMSPAIFLAVMGGMVRMSQSQKGFSLCFFVFGIISSAFVAIIVFLLLSDVNIEECYKVAIVGMSGYSSSEVLGVLKIKLLKKLGAKNVS